MKIYIASSWRNQHAVEMLTSMLREAGHEVVSFVDHEFSVNGNRCTLTEPEIATATLQFDHDTKGATTSDLVIYIGPSGCDAWAEVGAAWASDVPVFGLWAKAEPVGLMRHMVADWFTNYGELLKSVEELREERRLVRAGL